MSETILKRLGALLSVKSLVTLTLTGVFAFMACTNQISQDFMTIYAVTPLMGVGESESSPENPHLQRLLSERANDPA